VCAWHAACLLWTTSLQAAFPDTVSHNIKQVLGVLGEHGLAHGGGGGHVDSQQTCRLTVKGIQRLCAQIHQTGTCDHGGWSCGVSVCSGRRPMRWTCLGLGGGGLSMAVPTSRGFVGRRASSCTRGLVCTRVCVCVWGGGGTHRARQCLHAVCIC
jgi:hypothetical protein